MTTDLERAAEEYADNNRELYSHEYGSVDPPTDQAFIAGAAWQKKEVLEWVERNKVLQEAINYGESWYVVRLDDLRKAVEGDGIIRNDESKITLANGATITLSDEEGK